MPDDVLDLADDQAETDVGAERLRLFNWLWHPWYAKLWWSAIPLYWMAVGDPTRPVFLNEFAASEFALVANLLFIPITPLALLSLGYIRFALSVGRVEPRRRRPFKAFGRSSDYDSWFGLQNPNRFWHASIRKNLRF